MPIDIKQLEDATKPLSHRIQEFLAKHPDKAYSAIEIIAELEGHEDASTAAFVIALEGSGGGTSKTWEKYKNALADLSARKQVREAEVQGKIYYADVPRRP
ncbi:MAG TPA: hypothetical protein VF815_15920 [Myxococcaceae bacterium]